jgi:hypothetical protein
MPLLSSSFRTNRCSILSKQIDDGQKRILSMARHDRSGRDRARSCSGLGRCRAQQYLDGVQFADRVKPWVFEYFADHINALRTQVGTEDVVIVDEPDCVRPRAEPEKPLQSPLPLAGRQPVLQVVRIERPAGSSSACCVCLLAVQ